MVEGASESERGGYANGHFLGVKTYWADQKPIDMRQAKDEVKRMKDEKIECG